jgi:hypothetical protein
MPSRFQRKQIKTNSTECEKGCCVDYCNPPCDLFSFVNSLTEEEKNFGCFQDNVDCYDFDSFQIIGRINAFVQDFFQNNTVQENITITGNSYVCSYSCVDTSVCSCYFTNVDSSPDKIPETVLYGTWKGNTPGKVKKQSIVYDTNFQWTSFNGSFPSANDFPKFRCVNNKCIVNSKPFSSDDRICTSKCTGTIGGTNCAQDCIYPFHIQNPNPTPNVNLGSFYGKDKNAAIRMEVYLDTSSTQQNNDLSIISDFSKFQQKLLTSKSPLMGGVPFPTSFSYILSILCQVGTFASFFYHQIYDKFSKNAFTNEPFIDVGIQRFINQMIYRYYLYGSTDFPFASYFNDPNTYSNLICPLPKIQLKEGKYIVSFSMSYAMYTVINQQTPSNRLSSLSDKMRNLIDDGNSPSVVFFNQETQENISNTLQQAVYQNLVWDPTQMQCTYIDVSAIRTDTKAWNSVFSNESLADFLSAPRGKFLVNIQITFEIAKWSPMLFVYSKKVLNFPTNIDKNFAIRLSKDTNGLYPAYANFDNDFCGEEVKYFCYQQYCSLTFLPSSVRCRDPNQVKKIFFSSSSDCDCMNTNITPPNVFPYYANKDSMCYSNSCSLSTLNSFDISTTDCKDSCDTVNGWINTNNPSGTIQNYIYGFNRDKYQTNCNQIVGKIFNFYYFFFVFSGLVYCSLLFLRLLKTKKKRTLYLSLTITFSFAVSVAIGYIFNGRSICGGKDNKEVQCYSRVFYDSLQLPISCCQNRLVNCECQLDVDCQDVNFYCASGLCLPRAPKDYKQTTTYTFPTIDVIIFALNFMLALTVIFVLVKIPRLEKTMTVGIVCAVYGILFVLLFYLYWRQKEITYKK